MSAFTGIAGPVEITELMTGSADSGGSAGGSRIRVMKGAGWAWTWEGSSVEILLVENAKESASMGTSNFFKLPLPMTPPFPSPRPLNCPTTSLP